MPTMLISLLHTLPLATLALADGAFNVLTFNVAGLPESLQSNGLSIDKTTATTYIGQTFSRLEDQLDVIHVQEDFNYHATLYEYDTHPYRTSTSGGVPFGSGLNTLSNYNWLNFQRITWDDCSSGSGDCLAPKGFTTMRMELERGVYVTFINLHTDAGVEDGDEEARVSNVAQVADWIDANASEEAVVLFGDTNSRYTRELDNIRLFSEQNGLTDAWVEFVMDGVEPEQGAEAVVCDNAAASMECEIVDKVFYRGNDVVKLEVYGVDYVSDCFMYGDEILSDHNPLLVNFTYTVSSEYKTSELVGGDYSDYFNDIGSVSTGVKTTTITFAGDERLDSVGITLSDGTSFSHGGSGGTSASLTLGDDEYWTSAYVCVDTYDDKERVFYIKATTSAGNTLDAGTESGECTTMDAPAGYQIVGYYGEAGDEVDMLGFVFIEQ